MLIPAIDQLPAGDVVGDLLGLPQLSGQGPLSCCRHIEGEHAFVFHLVRVVLGQVLSHPGGTGSSVEFMIVFSSREVIE